MFRKMDDSLLAQYGVFAQQSVYRSAQGGLSLSDGWPAFKPGLHEDWGDAVARLDPRDSFADCDYVAGAIRHRYARQRHSGIVQAFYHHQIAVVQRGGPQFEKHLSGPRSGIGT